MYIMAKKKVKNKSIEDIGDALKKVDEDISKALKGVDVSINISFSNKPTKKKKK